MWGGSGWERKPGELKASGDWDLALGINVVNQHLAYYSIRGRRKRDYPAGCCYQIPGYDLYKSFNEYWARLSYALTRGQAERRVLLLHPQHSGWALYTPLDTARATALEKVWLKLTATLLETQRDYDLGEEMILENHARVEGGELIVGDMRYRAVVVPPPRRGRRTRWGCCGSWWRRAVWWSWLSRWRGSWTGRNPPIWRRSLRRRALYM